MTASSTLNVRDIFFDRTPPYLPDCCSVQAFGADPAGPILTIYRRHPSTAADWIAGAVRNKRFHNYLLRWLLSGWELYNARGELTDRDEYFPTSETGGSILAIPVDRAAFLRDARELTGDVGMSLIACREDHAGASAADHSNFNIACRRMIGEAGPADLEHVVIVDSRKWPCPVTGVFANVAQLSPPIQDVFLDRVKWLHNGWPMVSTEYHEALSFQLARLRQDYVCELLQDCGRVARMSEDCITAMVGKWQLAPPEAKYRFPLHIVHTLKDGLIYKKQSAEIFSREIVQRHGAAVVKDYEKHLTLSRF